MCPALPLSPPSLDAAARAAPAQVAVGLDDHMADVPGVAAVAAEQAPVAHDSAADACRHDHADVVAHADRGSSPSFPERKRLGVVVDEHGPLESFG
jgi:hypothetical protein